MQEDNDAPKKESGTKFVWLDYLSEGEFLEKNSPMCK